eukprot:12749114-Alexandrium_andersonii.AAC.1
MSLPASVFKNLKAPEGAIRSLSVVWGGVRRLVSGAAWALNAEPRQACSPCTHRPEQNAQRQSVEPCCDVARA